jgi:small subunit ribosomal protein S14
MARIIPVSIASVINSDVSRRQQKISVAYLRTPCIFSAPMAKKAWLERDKRKRNTVKKYAQLRAELKAAGDHVGLSMLPRDASPTRLVNRCRVSGRRRAFMRRFEMSRITFREMASQGLIPGVTKSSW